MRTEILRAPSQWSAPPIDEAWQLLCRRHGSLEVLFQSPVWFAHVAATRPAARQLVIVARDDAGAVVAVMPLQLEHVDLDFVVGARTFGRFHLPCLMVLGAEPLAPPEARLHEALLTALFAELGRDECVVMPMLSRDSPFRAAVDEWARRQQRDFFLYAPAIPGSGLVHALTLATTFDDYLGTHFNSKRRSNMKRCLKLLGKEIGPVRLQRYGAPDEVAPFLAAARPVSEASWQFTTVEAHFAASEDWERKLGDLARRGVLRCYMLFAGERAVAFVLGYEYAGVYYHVKTGYDRSLAKLAPGIGVLYLLLKELGEAPFKINFMFGDIEYKAEFGNVHQRSDELILMRRTARNLVRSDSHAAFRVGVTFARDKIRMRRPLRRAGPESPDSQE